MNGVCNNSREGHAAMRNNHDSNRSVNGQPDDLNSAFCWGAEAIGAVIGRNPRQTHHLLTRGEIKSAKKVGGRWVVSRATLNAQFVDSLTRWLTLLSEKQRVWLRHIAARLRRAA